MLRSLLVIAAVALAGLVLRPDGRAGGSRFGQGRSARTTGGETRGVVGDVVFSRGFQQKNNDTSAIAVIINDKNSRRGTGIVRDVREVTDGKRLT